VVIRLLSGLLRCLFGPGSEKEIILFCKRPDLDWVPLSSIFGGYWGLVLRVVKTAGA